MEFNFKYVRALFHRSYYIMVEDRGNTHNINMHTYFCFALSLDEAIGKMYRERPEFRNRTIDSVRSDFHNIDMFEHLEVTRLKDGKKFTPINPDPELGIYKSMLVLSELLGEKVGKLNFIEYQLVQDNPTRFVQKNILQ